MKLISTRNKAIGFAILAALLYGISSPVSKLLLVKISPTLMAALLYLGAGFGMLILNIIQVVFQKTGVEAKMTKREMPFIIGMILLDIAAPIFLMIGLTLTTSSNAALLNNFEIVATSIIALFIFKEMIGKRMWLAIGFITVASIVLSVSDLTSFSFSIGSVFVLLACLSWGFENNCTRMLSLKNPLHIVVIKGIGSGLGSLIIALAIKAYHFDLLYMMATLVLGFVAYGMSIFLYILAQRELGAARTSAYYAAAPFIGVLISWLILKEPITPSFLVALFIMLIGTYFAVSEDHSHEHHHLYEEHEHKHNHADDHHDHSHDEGHDPNFSPDLVHTHKHVHKPHKHDHAHTPDLHHRHAH